MEVAVPQKYAKPPIVEAVLELRFAPSTDGLDVAGVADLLGNRFPKSEGESDWELKITPNGPTPRQVDEGRKLTSATGEEIVVLRRNRVTVARIAPYPGWDAFRSFARESLSTVRERTGYRKIGQVGLRYVNRLDVPRSDTGRRASPEKYLTLVPSLGGRDDHQHPDSYDIRVDYRGTNGLVAVIHVATIMPQLIGHDAYLLDIDIIADANIPARESELWTLVDSMRDHKNQVFEQSITDDARKLFGQK